MTTEISTWTYDSLGGYSDEQEASFLRGPPKGRDAQQADVCPLALGGDVLLGGEIRTPSRLLLELLG